MSQRERDRKKNNKFTCKQIISGFHIRSSSHITLLRWFHFRYGEGTLGYKPLCFHAFLSASMLYDTTLNFSGTSNFIKQIVCMQHLKHNLFSIAFHNTIDQVPIPWKAIAYLWFYRILFINYHIGFPKSILYNWQRMTSILLSCYCSPIFLNWT